MILHGIIEIESALGRFAKCVLCNPFTIRRLPRSSGSKHFTERLIHLTASLRVLLLDNLAQPMTRLMENATAIHDRVSRVF